MAKTNTKENQVISVIKIEHYSGLIAVKQNGLKKVYGHVLNPTYEITIKEIRNGL